MTRVRFALSALVLSLLTACGQGIPPQQNYGVVTGRVYDATTNQPVAGVMVETGGIIDSTTGSSGTYRLVNIPLGSETLVVTSVPSGYAIPAQYAQGFPYSIAAGQILNIDIPLTKQ